MNRKQRRKLEKDTKPSLLRYKRCVLLTQKFIDMGYSPIESVTFVNAKFWIPYVEVHNTHKNLIPIDPHFFNTQIRKDMEIEEEKETISTFGKVADFIAERG